MFDDRLEPPESEETFVWTSDKIESYKIASPPGGISKPYPHGMTIETLLEDKRRLEDQIKLYQLLEKNLREKMDEAEKHCLRLIGERDYWMELAMVFEEELKALEGKNETEVHDVDDDHNFELGL